MYSLIKVEGNRYYVEYWGVEFSPTLLEFNSRNDFMKWAVGKCEM